MHAEKIRIWFFGTPSLAATVLSAICEDARFEVCFAVTNPDKPFGRDQTMKASPVKEMALKKHIPLYTPTKIRENHEFFEQLWNHNCDYFIVVAYGKIVPQELLDIPKKMCINVHGSILPKHRGASPIQSALIHWDRETGVTIMKMSLGMDEGDILKIRTIPIIPRETSGTLFEKFAQVSPWALIDTLLELEHGGITSLPQDHSSATYCKKIAKEDGCIDWNKSAQEIYHMWQAYTPWPGIYTVYEEKRLILEQVTNYEWIITNSGTIGEITKLEDGMIWVICGEWVLTLWQVKLEWKKSQSIRDFLNGNQKFIWYNF